MRFCPEYDPDESEKRELWVTPKLDEWLRKREGSPDFKPRIRQSLKHYVIGGLMDDQDRMKSWRDDVFEFRIQFEPKIPANTRVFGGFMQQDKFVATRWKPRAHFKTDQQWDKEIDGVLNDWAALFGARARVPARPFRGCICENGWDPMKGETW